MNTYRLLDLFLTLTFLPLYLPVFAIGFLLSWIDTGSPMFTQKRVGLNGKTFTLFKLRTLPVGTESVPTHELPDGVISRIGNFLRKSRLDEVPQLFNVIIGDMSLVGPRPCLVTQSEIKYLRSSAGLFLYRPGITGLAQVKGVTMADPELMVNLEIEMMRKLNISEYFRLILYTVIGVKCD